MKILSIIPARGGSKGIPKKNIKSLAGKPLIAYTIENSIKSHFINRAIVSTDDSEIAEISKHYGAEIVYRPVEISGDLASSESALIHCLDYLYKTEGYEPDLLVFLQCTSPLTLPEDIDGTIEILLNEHADSALSVTLFHYFLWKKDSNGEITGINHNKKIRPLRQEREPQFLETGAIYVMRTKGFKEAKHRFFGKTSMYIMPQERCLEIDEPIDIEIAEVIMKNCKNKEKISRLPASPRALIMDFDGVFTDNKVIVFQDGREGVLCDRSDGLRLTELRNSGILILVLSTEQNPVVKARCNKLGIDCIHGVKAKLPVLIEWAEQHEINLSDIIYAGNDINDIECLKASGCGVSVNDAYKEAKESSKIILSSCGGRGAIREISELILERIKR